MTYTQRATKLCNELDLLGSLSANEAQKSAVALIEIAFGEVAKEAFDQAYKASTAPADGDEDEEDEEDDEDDDDLLDEDPDQEDDDN